MAVVNVKSLAVTNRDATPVILSNDATAKGKIVGFVGVVTATSGDSIASTYRFGQIPSNARLQSILLSCDALGGTTAGTIDIYDTTANGGAIIATTGTKALNGGVSLVSALASAEQLGGGTSAAGYVPLKREKFLWDLLALTVDPCKQYDVVITLTAAVTSTGGIALAVEWV